MAILHFKSKRVFFALFLFLALLIGAVGSSSIAHAQVRQARLPAVRNLTADNPICVNTFNTNNLATGIHVAVTNYSEGDICDGQRPDVTKCEKNNVNDVMQAQPIRIQELKPAGTFTLKYSSTCGTNWAEFTPQSDTSSLVNIWLIRSDGAYVSSYESGNMGTTTIQSSMIYAPGRSVAACAEFSEAGKSNWYSCLTQATFIQDFTAIHTNNSDFKTAIQKQGNLKDNQIKGLWQALGLQ